MDSTVIVWQAETGDALYNIPGGFEDEKVCIGSWSPSGDRFATRGRGGAKVYDTATGRTDLEPICAGSLYYSCDLVTGRKAIVDLRLRGWDCPAVGCRKRSGAGPHYRVWFKQAVRIGLRRGYLAAVGGYDSMVHLWDMVTGQEIAELSGTVPAPWHLAFSPDGKRLLTMGSGHNVNIYDLSEASH